MKTLLILRHAKAERGDTALPDHDRVLAPRGESDAPRMGTALAAIECLPDRIVTSTATRARETARLVAAAMGYGGKMVEEAAVYGASAGELLEIVRAQPGPAATLLLVGHNPGLEELIGLLAGGEGAPPALRLPTAGLACLTLDSEAWGTVLPGCGLLQWLLTPRIASRLLRASH